MLNMCRELGFAAHHDPEDMSVMNVTLDLSKAQDMAPCQTQVQDLRSKAG